MPQMGSEVFADISGDVARSESSESSRYSESLKSDKSRPVEVARTFATIPEVGIESTLAPEITNVCSFILQAAFVFTHLHRQPALFPVVKPRSKQYSLDEDLDADDSMCNSCSSNTVASMR